MLAILGMGNGELIIVLFIVLLLFGAQKLPQLAKGLGQSVKAFKKASAEEHPDDDAAAPAHDSAEEIVVVKKKKPIEAKVLPAAPAKKVRIVEVEEGEDVEAAVARARAKSARD